MLDKQEVFNQLFLSKPEDRFIVPAQRKTKEIMLYLQFLLVHREVAGLDVEHSITRETQHVLIACVPCHAVCIWLLWGNKQ